MTLEEKLAEAGVETFEALEAKIKADAAAEVKATAAAEEAKLRKQITDLETIKASQGGEIGTLRKDSEALAEAERKLAELEESKNPENAAEPPKVEKTEDQWKQENDKKLLTVSDDDLARLNKTISENDALKAIAATEAGKAGLIEKILGSTEEQSQEIFRRPVHEKKLSVAEQIEQALGKKPSGTPANRRPQGPAPSYTPDKNNQSGSPVVGASMATRMAALQT